MPRKHIMQYQQYQQYQQQQQHYPQYCYFQAHQREFSGITGAGLSQASFSSYLSV